MSKLVVVGLIGDQNSAVPAHRAIPIALVRLLPGTKLRAAYGAPEVAAEYLCRYGLNAEFKAALVSGPLREAARDEAGDLRAVELDGHPFFVGTLFQPERAALKGRSVPIVKAFLEAIRARHPS